MLTIITASSPSVGAFATSFLFEFLLLVLIAVGLLFLVFFLIAKRMTHSLNRQVKTKASEVDVAAQQLSEVHGELSLRNAQMEMMAKAMYDGVVVTDATGKVTLFSPAMEVLTGISEDTALGAPIDDVLAFRDKKREFDPLFEHVIEHGTAISPPSTVLVTPDEDFVDVSYTAGVLKNADGLQGIMLVVRDVSREREVDRLKSDFVSLASHQLRTPLTTAKWTYEMILDSDQSSVIPIPVLEQLNVLRRANTRMIDLVESLLDLKQIEDGSASFVMQDVPFDELVREVANELKPLLEERQVTVALSLREGESDELQSYPSVQADGFRLREVVHAILENAVLLTPRNGAIRVTLTQNREKGEVDLAIQDQGNGIPLSEGGHIFEPFYRGMEMQRLSPDGVGLSLSVAKQVIESAKGKIWFTSEEGRGSVFHVTLPLSDVSQ